MFQPRRPSRQQIERERDLRDVMTSERNRWFRRADDEDVKRSGEDIVFTACDIVKRRGLTVNFAAVRGTGLVGGMPAHVVRAYVDKWNARAHGQQPQTPLLAPLGVYAPAGAAAAPPTPAAETGQKNPAAAPAAVAATQARDILPHADVPTAPTAPEARPAAASPAPHTLRGRFAKTIDSPRGGRPTPVESLVLATRTPLSGGMLDLRAMVERDVCSAD